MGIHIDRSVKAHCPDFSPVRRLLEEFGATQVEVKEQLDYFYHLGVTEGGKATQRLKLRIENEEKLFLYYYDRKDRDIGATQFQLWEIGDIQMKSILDAALGVRATVRKQREVWQQGNVIFNLDTVEGVGQIFEIEILPKESCDPLAEVTEYLDCFDPFLGVHLTGSNEDLVSPSH